MDYAILKPTLIPCLLQRYLNGLGNRITGLHIDILTGGEPLLNSPFLVQFLPPNLTGWGYPSAWKLVDIVRRAAALWSAMPRLWVWT